MGGRTQVHVHCPIRLRNRREPTPQLPPTTRHSYPAPLSLITVAPNYYSVQFRNSSHQHRLCLLTSFLTTQSTPTLTMCSAGPTRQLLNNVLLTMTTSFSNRGMNWFPIFSSLVAFTVSRKSCIFLSRLFDVQTNQANDFILWRSCFYVAGLFWLLRWLNYSLWIAYL